MFFLQDLGNSELNKDIYIVAHIMRIGKMLYSDSSKKTEKAVAQQQVFKRPHGVAVQNIGDYLTSKESDTDEKEFSMKVWIGSGYICLFSLNPIHQNFYFYIFDIIIINCYLFYL